ncbi:protein unc-45 homolog B-like isoform X2 [Babylonia areolata]
MGDPQSLKEEGNGHFKSGQYKEACRCYSQALEVGGMKDAEKAIIFKNRAACRLKLNDNLAAVEDCTASLNLVDNDPKALFRRCQAFDALGKVEEAYKDVMTLMRVDPKNSAVVPIYQKLNPIMQDKVKKQTSLMSRVAQMFNLAFDSTVPIEKRTQAFSNLLVLTREDAGANLICHEGGIDRLLATLKEKPPAVVAGAFRVLAGIVKGSAKRSAVVASAADMTFILILMGQGSSEVTGAASHLVQMLLNWYVGLEDFAEATRRCEEQKKKGERVRWPQLKLSEEQQQFVDSVFQMLVKMFDSAKVTPDGRDMAMELVMKNVTYKKGAGWTQKFLDSDAIDGLLTVAGTQKQFKTLSVTEMSRMHASVVLSTVYEDCVSDKQRETFKEKCASFLKYLFGDGVVESKIEAIEIISSLLQGPYEVGSMLLGIEGVVQIMFTLAASDNTHFQRVAVEAIVHSASKKDRCVGILKDAIPILKNLYKSSEESIQVRALVGLCKLGSFAGGDASEHPMADGSTLKLSRICRKFLVNTNKDSDLGKWATEGLAYLTLDAEVKEELAADTSALKVIFDLAKNSERNMTYACVTVLVNLTNSYDKQEMMPEMVELAKFAKQHIPEEHEKDKHDFVVKRIQTLAKAGVTNALVSLSSTESKNSRELLCRVYLALATEESLRGLLVQQGAVKSLLQLTENNTEVGSVLAAHGLAKIAITLDPSTAFPGQRVYEVVRPLISLLHTERTGLQNFEALLSLTNLSSLSESVRKRILTDRGLQSIERCMFEEHAMIRRAATECMCNMMMSETVLEMCEGDNDRVKMMVLFAGEEDLHLVRAASGALAFMSSNRKLAHKMTQVQSWLEILQQILVTDNLEIQHRACHLVMNLMAVDKEIATLLVQSQVLEILMAITKLEGAELADIRQCAQSALDTATEHGLIQPFQTPTGTLQQLRESLSIKPLTITEVSDEEQEAEEEKPDEGSQSWAHHREFRGDDDEEFEEEFGISESGETRKGGENEKTTDSQGEKSSDEAAERLTADCTAQEGVEEDRLKPKADDKNPAKDQTEEPVPRKEESTPSASVDPAKSSDSPSSDGVGAT